MNINLYENDIPKSLNLGNVIAVDTETMGLKHGRDRLCLAQISSGDGNAHIVRFDKESNYDCPNLKALLSDRKITKIFHFARFDIATLLFHLDIECPSVYCTRTASVLARTYSCKHSLREICSELLGVEIDKTQQSSYWGDEKLTEKQRSYAASDVLYLHRLKEKLDFMLERESKKELAEECFKFIPLLAHLDISGWQDKDIFSHF